DSADQTAEEPMARRVETYQGTTDRQQAGRAVKNRTPKEGKSVMTEIAIEEPKEVTIDPAATAEVTPQVKKMHILICYDAGDVKHLGDLDRHLQLMYRRLGSQVKRHYFYYGQVPEEPKPYTGDYQSLKEHYQKEKEGYEEQLK